MEGACSWSATRCSRSTVSARRRWRSFCGRVEQGLGSVNLEPLTLSTNFRSQKNLIGFFNSAFGEILPKAADAFSGAVPYSRAEPRHRALAGEAATWHALPDRESEARRVVDLVREAKDRAAILVRKREALADIVPALKAAGIRFRAIDIEHLGEKQVVQDLYALTRALSHLGDRIAWLSILRAPWCALSLNDLHAIAGSDRHATIWELIQENRNLERFRKIVAPAITDRGRGSLRDRVEGVWLALGGPACVQSATDLEDVEIYLDALESLEGAAGDLDDLGALDEALHQLYALPDLEATEDDLQIMTIHKSKGLEFGTVIVPGLDKGPGRADTPLFLWRERSAACFLRRSRKPAPMTILPTAICATSKPRPRTSRRRGSFTSPPHAPRAGCTFSRAPSATTPASSSRPRRARSSRAPGPWPRRTMRAWSPSSYAMEFMHAPRAPITTLTRLELDLERVAPPPSVTWAPPPEPRAQQDIEFSWAGETARHVGSVVHRWLQRMAEDELSGWDAKRIASLGGLFRRDLQRRGVATADLARSAEIVARALGNALSDKRGRWLLGPHPEARNEYRLRGVMQGRIGTYVIDRLFRGADGVEWLVDYKTSRHEGAGVEAFLDRERDRYSAAASHLCGFAKR